MLFLIEKIHFCHHRRHKPKKHAFLLFVVIQKPLTNTPIWTRNYPNVKVTKIIYSMILNIFVWGAHSHITERKIWIPLHTVQPDLCHIEGMYTSWGNTGKILINFLCKIKEPRYFYMFLQCVYSFIQDTQHLSWARHLSRCSTNTDSLNPHNNYENGFLPSPCYRWGNWNGKSK